MSDAINRHRMRKYLNGLDVLGDGIGVGDFVPWLGLVGKVAGGLAGTSGSGDAKAQQAAIEKARAEERAKAKAEAEAAKTRTLVYTTLGIVGAVVLGGVVYAVAKK